MKKFWTTEEDNKIRNNKREKESWGDFALREMPYRSADSVRLRAIRYLGINNNEYRSRKHFFNEDIWKELTPESCYWAGFIAADGCIVKYGSGEGCTLAIDLHVKDSHHLEKFAKFCGYTGSLRKIQERKFYNKNTKKTYHTTTQAIMINVGLKWLDDLKNNFSITQRKTFTLQPPDIQDTYLKHCYIIGAIDGDGCIHHRKDGTKMIYFTSASKEFINWYRTEVDMIIRGTQIRKKPRKISRYINNYEYRISGNSADFLINYFSSFSSPPYSLPMLKKKWSLTP